MLPLVASSRSAASATVRASGPMQVRPLKASASGQVEIRPRCGFRPTRPVQAAGIRIDPAPSDPSAAGISPAATAAAAPPLEPPGVWAVLQGLRVAPNEGPSVNGHWPTSGAWVLPITIAPASRSRRTTSWSPSAGGREPPQPKRVGCPVRSRSSLIAVGTPSSGAPSPRGDPAVRGVGLLERLLGANHPERVEVGLGGLGATQRVLDQLPRGDAAGAQHPHLLEKPEGGGVRWGGAGLGRHRSPSSRKTVRSNEQ